MLRCLRVAICLFAITATIAAFRYGLPPKEGPAFSSVWWFPIAYPLFLLIGDPMLGLLLGLLQFPALAAMMIYGLRRWPVKRVFWVTFISYMSALAICVCVTKLIELVARR